MEKFMNIWPRRPQQDFILPPNMRLRRHPHCPNSCTFSVKLLRFSLAQTAQYARQCSWCCMQGISLLITPATIWSPIYPDLWTCLVRDSGLFKFLTQILIWFYSVAVLSQIYLAWIQYKELHTHTYTHTHTSVQYPVFYSSSALQPAWAFCAGSYATNDRSDPFWQ